MNTVTFHRAGYPGSVVIHVNGDHYDYIDRSVDHPNLWVYDGRYFGSLAEARETARYELENNV